MTLKTFFKPRSEKEILALPSKVANPRTLAEKLLESEEEAFLIQTNVIPSSFYQGKTNDYQAERAYEKRGPTLPLEHPVTLKECVEANTTLRTIAKETFEQERAFRIPVINDYIGYRFQPNWGDRTRRVVFFSTLLEGTLLYLYSSQNAPIKVEDKYSGPNNSFFRGSEILVSVPSRSQKGRRYNFKFQHGPFHPESNNLANSISLKSSASLQEGLNRPKSEDWNISYNRNGPLERIVYLPQDVAGYIAFAKKQKEDGNEIPQKFSPFLFPSPELMKIYLKLRDNCLILNVKGDNEDPTHLFAKEKYRHLYLQEKSNILSSFIGVNAFKFDSLFPEELKEEEYLKIIN